MPNIDITEILKLFKDNLLYMLIALGLILATFIILKFLGKNRIGNIKSKNTKIHQKGKGSITGDIESDDLDIKQE